MSGIAGIVSFDGAPVDIGLVRSMSDAVRHRGPDAGDCWSAAGIAMGSRVMWSTPESLSETGPLHDAAERVCVALDGRIDNREELLRALGLDAADRMSDAALLLRAYKAWGEDVPGRIAGDFAFALWDGTKRTLFCARDVMGVRPFCYFIGARHLAFGSELQQLFLDPGVSDALNEPMIGEYLAWSITTADETLFRDIRRLPPAHAMTVQPGGALRVRRYWDIDFGARIRHPRTDDYAQHLAGLLRECVASRLRVHGAVGSHLSGGLDSSSVSVIARDLLHAGGQCTEGFEAYSVVFPSLPCDESQQVDAIARHAALRVERLSCREVDERGFVARAARTRDFPGYPMANAILGTVATAASARGRRVLLTGEGGDEILGGDADQLADLAIRLRFNELWHEARGTGNALDLSTARALLRHGIKPWARRAAIHSGWIGLRKPDLSWLAPDWIAGIDLRERIAPPHSPDRRASCAQLAAYRATFSAHATHFLEMTDLCGFAAGVEYRHPMLDRRLVEFAYAVPQEMHRRRGRSKCLLREAMRGLLPEATIAPGSSVDFTVLNVRALDRILRDRPIEDWPAARASWVQAGRLHADYMHARADLLAGRAWAGRPIWNLWMAYGVGAAVEERRR